LSWFTLDPVTRKRVHRFRRIRRGYYSLLILLAAMVLAVFAPYLAESRALAVWYKGQVYLPTFEYYEMKAFGQEPPAAWDTGEIETEDNVLVIRRIHVAMRLVAGAELKDKIERVHGMYAMNCPLYRTLHKAIELTSSYELVAHS